MVLQVKTLDFDSETLLNIGFIDIGKWQLESKFIQYVLDGADSIGNNVFLDVPNALYAFVIHQQVVYIGKTARSIRKRYTSYCRPGSTQATNQRCHRNIKAALAEGQEVRIFVFTPITHLRYSDFEINLAAGLEDSLIRQFDPIWNGRDRGRPVSEEAEREEVEENELVSPAATTAADAAQQAPHPLQCAARFTILLAATYYRQGIVNPGVDASKHLGNNGDPLRITFSDGRTPVISKINRTANRNGSVRVIGGNAQIAEWFQDHFKEGDVLNGLVVDEHTLCLLLN